MAEPMLDSVEFRFTGGTTVTFSHAKTQWIRWSARVSTADDRTEAHRQQRPVGSAGQVFGDDFLQPTLIHAKRLVKRAAEERAKGRLQTA